MFARVHVRHCIPTAALAQKRACAYNRSLIRTQSLSGRSVAKYKLYIYNIYITFKELPIDYSQALINCLGYRYPLNIDNTKNVAMDLIKLFSDRHIRRCS